MSKYFVTKAIVAYFIIISFLMCINSSTIVPFIWILMSSFTIIYFFYGVNIIPQYWAKYSDISFRKKLFRTAVVIRLIAVFFFYIFFNVMYDNPFEFAAGDSLFYDEIGLEVSEYISHLGFGVNNFLANQNINLSDRGYPIFLGVVYTLFFKSILLARIVQAFLGARSCLFVYDFTKRNFNEPVARIAAIIMMLFPFLIYYSGLHLKETVMVYLLLLAINYSDKLLKEKKSTIKIILLAFVPMFLLFFFRTVLAVSLFFSFFFSLLVLSTKITGYKKKSLIIILIMVLLGYLFTSRLMEEELNPYLEGIATNQEVQLKHFSNREGSNKLAKYGSAIVFAPFLLSAPFPTLVDTGQESAMMTGGALYIRSILSFFVIISLILIYNTHAWRFHSLILAYLFSSLTILAFSGFVLSPRFHIPILPVFAIFAANGLYAIQTQYTYLKKYYPPFIFIISLIIIGWNIFKLAGRDLI